MAELRKLVFVRAVYITEDRDMAELLAVMRMVAASPESEGLQGMEPEVGGGWC